MIISQKKHILNHLTCNRERVLITAVCLETLLQVNELFYQNKPFQSRMNVHLATQTFEITRQTVALFFSNHEISLWSHIKKDDLNSLINGRVT